MHGVNAPESVSFWLTSSSRRVHCPSQVYSYERSSEFVLFVNITNKSKLYPCTLIPLATDQQVRERDYKQVVVVVVVDVNKLRLGGLSPLPEPPLRRTLTLKVR